MLLRAFDRLLSSDSAGGILLILWVSDGLMAVFFLIGLKLKYELLDGKLTNPRDVFLPGAAEVGGAEQGLAA